MSHVDQFGHKQWRTQGKKRKLKVVEAKGGGGELHGISLLPGRGPGQTFEAWLRISGEDDVPG